MNLRLSSDCEACRKVPDSHLGADGARVVIAGVTKAAGSGVLSCCQSSASPGVFALISMSAQCSIRRSNGSSTSSSMPSANIRA